MCHVDNLSDYLKVAGFLDLRFKMLPFLIPEERDATEKKVVTWCTKKVEQSDEFLQAQRLASELQQEESGAVGALAAEQHACSQSSVGGDHCHTSSPGTQGEGG